MSNFISIHKLGRDEIVINKSKFIGSAVPVKSEEEAIDFIDNIKKEFKDSSHCVYAYVIGENMNIQRFSDDGEPSGTAGMPVLNVIKQENLRNVAVVVTRYFGGVLLGAGGLVRAYTKGAKIALEKGLIVDKNLYYNVSFKLDYTLLGKADNLLLKNNFFVKNKIFEDNVTIMLLVKEDETDKLTSLLNDLTGGKAEITIGQAEYYSVLNGKLLED